MPQDAVLLASPTAAQYAHDELNETAAFVFFSEASLAKRSILMFNGDHDRIERAERAHKSVKGALRHSDKTILSHPTVQIIHSLQSTQRAPITGPPEDLKVLALHKLISPKAGEFLMPTFPDDLELSFRERWSSGGDHFLLMEMLSHGRLPLAYREYWTPDNPPSLTAALTNARALGYQVPDTFIGERDLTYCEREAFHAAYCFVSGSPTMFRGHSYWDVKELSTWRPFLCQFTGQFIIPDPLEPRKTPYCIDQLWIFLLPDRRVRFLALEVDGEKHLEAGVAEKDKRRDIMLTAMGYEMFHVAGWWCRIDPYHVIADFLKIAGICKVAPEYLAGYKSTIDDYYCDVCGCPMVRWDYDDILEADVSGRTLVGHKSCIEEQCVDFGES